MNETCSKCPIAEHCLRQKDFCDWMKAENPNPLHVRHIIGRSKLAAGIELEYPSTGAMVRNLWRDILAFARSGGKLAPKALRIARLAVCEPCEKWDARQRRCTACGCKMDAKTYSLVAKCPLEKWPKHKVATS
jgi:hypothetical protein